MDTGYTEPADGSTDNKLFLFFSHVVGNPFISCLVVNCLWLKAKVKNLPVWVQFIIDVTYLSPTVLHIYQAELVAFLYRKPEDPLHAKTDKFQEHLCSAHSR